MQDLACCRLQITGNIHLSAFLHWFLPETACFDFQCVSIGLIPSHILEFLWSCNSPLGLPSDMVRTAAHNQWQDCSYQSCPVRAWSSFWEGQEDSSCQLQLGKRVPQTLLASTADVPGNPHQSSFLLRLRLLPPFAGWKSNTHATWLSSTECKRCCHAKLSIHSSCNKNWQLVRLKNKHLSNCSQLPSCSSETGRKKHYTP